MKPRPPKEYVVTAIPIHNSKLDEPVYVGETLYTCLKSDYGSSSTDSSIHNEQFISLTRKVDGDYPFITMPMSCIKQVS